MSPPQSQTLSLKLFAMSVEVEGDAAFVAKTVRSLTERLQPHRIMETASMPALPVARVIRCGICRAMGHNRRTCTISGGGRGPA